ncbi:DinB family protein [Cellulomonas sp. NPDC057328]|uniref:DinB family protein n=1 Tax=Cellulomonas sp. NPDC057328 TaxID=3346101 RepID=UPI00363649E7
MDDKETLHRYLRGSRDDLLSTLDGLDDYDVRRPLTPTGTNLLGLVKHVATVQVGYLGGVFGRPSPLEEVPWAADDAEPDADLWAGPEESRADVLAFWAGSAAHADATVAALPLDARGVVPWWGPQRRDVTLHAVLVHLLGEVARHAGHADILREGLDGRAGQRPGDANVTGRTAEEWAAHRARLDEAARRAAGRAPRD